MKIQNTENDSVKIKCMIDLGLALQVSPYELYKRKSGYAYVHEALGLQQETHTFSNIGYYLDSLGVQYRRKSNFAVALRLHQLVENYAGTVGDSKLLSIVNNNIGVVYRYMDDYKKALTYHLKAYELAERERDSVSMAIAINSLGNVEVMLGEYDMALSYFKKSLQLEQNRQNLLGIAINFENIGSVYFQKGNYQKAAEYYTLSLDINRRIHSKKGEAICYSDLASVFAREKKYKIAETYLKHSIELFLEVEDRVMLADVYTQLGKVYAENQQFSDAEKSTVEGLILAKKIGLKSVLEEGYKTLYQVYKKQKKYAKALTNLELANVYHDSVNNLSIQKEIARLQLQFESKQKENQILLLQQQAKIRELNLNKQKVLNYFLFTAFLLSLVIVLVLSKYLRNKDRLNKKLMEKNLEIEAAQKKLMQQGKDLEKAKLRAEESDRSKSEFLANISHEIRTPLNAVIGFSGVLEQTTNDPKVKEYVQSIKSSGESLLTLLNDILDLSKIEAGKINITYEPIHIRNFLSEIKRIFEVETARKSIGLTISIDDEVPEVIVLSRNRLRQILINIIGNAIKFTDKGGVTVALLQNKRNREDEIELIIRVTDTGRGIALQDQKMIFAPFYQAENNVSDTGTGLGLAITKKLVDILNGEIAVSSEVGVGTRFTLKFKHVKIADRTGDRQTTGQPLGKTDFVALLISDNNVLYDECNNFFRQRFRKVLQVGTNLKLIKEHIDEANIVIIVGLSEEMMNNTMAVIAKEGKEKMLVVIGHTRQNSQGVYYLPKGCSMSKIKTDLNEIINRLQKEQRNTSLFVNLQGVIPDKGFKDALRRIMENEYKNATQSKMMRQIKLLSGKLLELAQRENLPNLTGFAVELRKMVELFDIKKVDEYLEILMEAYRKLEREE